MLICINYVTVSLLQSSFVGAIAIGDLVKTTLGPKGMVKRFLVLVLASFVVCFVD